MIQPKRNLNIKSISKVPLDAVCIIHPVNNMILNDMIPHSIDIIVLYLLKKDLNFFSI